MRPFSITIAPWSIVVPSPSRILSARRSSARVSTVGWAAPGAAGAARSAEAQQSSSSIRSILRVQDQASGREHTLHARPRIERVAVEQQQVRVLAALDAAE